MADDSPLDVAKLNALYSKAESCDRKLFSEMRSNVLMVSGDHYKNTQRRLWSRIKDSRNLEQDQKIRLVKNRIFRNTRIYINELISQSPGVRPFAHSEEELQDQKAAEIANAVWQDAKHRHNLNERLKDWVEDFVDLGEMAVKIFWDPNKGDLVGYNQATTEEGSPLYHHPISGDPVVDPHTQDPMTGQIIPHEPVKDEKKPVFKGDFVFETIQGFNLLRDPAAETMDESKYLITRKMMDVSEAKALAGGDKDKEAFIQESSSSTFKVFDGGRGEYVDSKGQVMLREIFWRKCVKYPNGWYCLFTDKGIIFESELPFGIFPIIWRGFQKIQTTPRAHSIIRVMRPFQAEINRMASQKAANSIAFGDDKLIVQAGAKVEKGGDLPGVRVIRVQGQPPTVLPGRNGDQFADDIKSNIYEMDDAVFLSDMKEDNGQLDPQALLFRSMKHKKKFSLYATSVEQFLIEVCRTYLKLAQKYFDQDQMIRAIGKRSYIDIPEFKEVSDLDYSIKLDAVGDDIETMLGKSMQIREILQYVGKDLSKEARAQILSAMPFLNGDQMFSDLTMDVKNADSDILALDRGQYVQGRKGENHDYLLKRLTNRMKMRDFDLLSPEIKQMYEQKIQEQEAIKVQELQELKQMQSEFIPTGGALIGVDLFVPVPNSTGGVKTVRARLPQEAVDWLMKQLETQGSAQEALQNQSSGTLGDISNQYQSSQSGQGRQVGAPSMSQQPQMSKPGQGAMNGIGYDPRQLAGITGLAGNH